MTDINDIFAHFLLSLETDETEDLPIISLSVMENLYYEV
jgi:hypothetical protein